LAQGFNEFKSKSDSLESARDSVRSLLPAKRPTDFAGGPYLVALDLLASEIFGDRNWGHRTRKCGRCDHFDSSVPWFSSHQTITEAPELKARYKRNYAVSHWLTAQKIRSAHRSCPECGNGMIETMTLDVHNMQGNNITIDSELNPDI
jgi:hypothetical protein